MARSTHRSRSDSAVGRLPVDHRRRCTDASGSTVRRARIDRGRVLIAIARGGRRCSILAVLHRRLVQRSWLGAGPVRLVSRAGR